MGPTKGCSWGWYGLFAPVPSAINLSAPGHSFAAAEKGSQPSETDPSPGRSFALPSPLQGCRNVAWCQARVLPANLGKRPTLLKDLHNTSYLDL